MGRAIVSSVRTTTSASESIYAAPEPGTLADAMRASAAREAAGSPEAGFCELWRARAVRAVADAVQSAKEATPEVDAYVALEKLQGSMAALMSSAEREDAELEAEIASWTWTG